MTADTGVRTSATVETLTAQVRTLVVGTRQITLSVANQLDVIPLDQLTVMGRVRLRSDTPGTKHVIGADLDGNLSLATYDPYRIARPPWISAGDIEGFATVCRSSFRSNYAGVSLRIDGVNFNLDTEATEKCAVEEHSWKGECGHWDAPDVVKEQIRQEIIAWQIADQGDVDAHQAAANAPLIVLAGLR